MTAEDCSAALSMMRMYGGGFIKALAECYARADEDNRLRLVVAFSPEFAKYLHMAQAEKAMLKAGAA